MSATAERDDGQPRNLDRAFLRKLLEQVLLSTADFDAFCLDSFPDVYRRLDGTPDLRTKQNLLLMLVEPHELLTKLRSAHPERVKRCEKTDEPLLLQRERELSEHLAQLLMEREIILKWAEDTRKIDAEISLAQTALRHGPALHAGEVLSGRYQLAESLGNGTFAEVWQAKILGGADGETVALKVLHGRWCKDAPFIQRFERGAKVLAQLSHPHIVKLLVPATESQGFHYLATEYLAGGDLHQAVLKDPIQQHRERWVQAVFDVGSALDYAHRKIPTLVHRDVKPHNILLDEHGQAKLCDFDLVLDASAVRGTQTNQALGTQDYAAPEQLQDAAHVDQRADVYGLARTMLFVLHGRKLGGSSEQRVPLIERVQTTSAVKAVLRRALEWEPDDRYESVAAFCTELQAALRVRESPVARIESSEMAVHTVPILESIPIESIPIESIPLVSIPVEREDSLLAGSAPTEHDQGASSDKLVPEDVQRSTSQPARPGRTRTLAIGLVVALTGTTGVLVWRGIRTEQQPARLVSQPKVVVDPVKSMDLATLAGPAKEALNGVQVTKQPPTMPQGWLGNDYEGESFAADVSAMVGPPRPRSEAAFVKQPNAVVAPKPADMGVPTNRRPQVGEMVKVPSGTFLMGSDDGESDERPVHTEQVATFWMDKYEVTMEQYAECVKAGRCKTPESGDLCNANQAGKEKHPANCVSWTEARDYCRWAGKRLPSEEEWEYAARGPTAKKYPWGDNAPTTEPCWKRWYKREGSCAVGSRPQDNGCVGIMDLGVNVWEWVQDVWRENYSPDGLTNGALRVVRGDSWSSDSPWRLRSAYRTGFKPTDRYDFVGFRCARSK